MHNITSVIFDLGGVLIDWNPHYLFDEQYFDSAEQRDFFFSRVCTPDWNENQDAGYPIHQATEDKIAEFPDWEKPIRDYYGRWTDMLKGPINPTVELFRQIKQSGKYKTYALTNWSAETFPIALERFDFLHWFDGRVVSGEEKMRKPFPEFYQLLLDRYAVQPGEALFIDDNLRNIKAAEAMGISSILFSDAGHLATRLTEEGLL